MFQARGASETVCRIVKLWCTSYIIIHHNAYVNIIQYVYVTVEITQGKLFLLTSVTCDSRSASGCIDPMPWALILGLADCKCLECTWFLQGVLLGEYVCTSQKGCWCHFRSKDVLTCTGPMDKRGAGQEFLAAGKAQRSVASRAHVSRSWSANCIYLWAFESSNIRKPSTRAMFERWPSNSVMVGCTVHGIRWVFSAFFLRDPGFGPSQLHVGLGL